MRFMSRLANFSPGSFSLISNGKYSMQRNTNAPSFPVEESVIMYRGEDQTSISTCHSHNWNHMNRKSGPSYMKMSLRNYYTINTN